jgi:hypothetical protein
MGVPGNLYRTGVGWTQPHPGRVWGLVDLRYGLRFTVDGFLLG